MNRSKIEWCDYTWNPITGCRHNCPYCYAERMTARFAGDVRLNLMARKDYSLTPAADGGADLYELDAPMLNETGKPLAYPFGFTPTFHRYRMDFLDKLKMGGNIFVGAMADVFGEWAPDEWIREVFEACLKRPIHNYLFLTKNPERYGHMEAAGTLPAGENFWYGSTLARPEDKCFISIRHHTFWSIEPIHAPFQVLGKDGFFPDWIIIGAETGRCKEKIVPCREWIEGILEQCDRAGVPVFMKESLLPIVGEGGMRRDFPEGLRNLRISPKMEKRLFDACAKCKRRMKKSDMLTLFARSRRGERPKQFGFMCESCFKEFCQGLDLNVPEFEGQKEEALPGEGEGNG